MWYTSRAWSGEDQQRTHTGIHSIPTQSCSYQEVAITLLVSLEDKYSLGPLRSTGTTWIDVQRECEYGVYAGACITYIYIYIYLCVFACVLVHPYPDILFPHLFFFKWGIRPANCLDNPHVAIQKNTTAEFIDATWLTLSIQWWCSMERISPYFRELSIEQDRESGIHVSLDETFTSWEKISIKDAFP